MLLLTSVLGLRLAGVLAGALAPGRRRTSTPLFQFLLMGLNGAFLTGDLFNLFVFFEVLLAASYGLVLHGSGPRASRPGCTTSPSTWPPRCCFLIGVSLIYGVTGTLNMADLARRIPPSPGSDRMLARGRRRASSASPSSSRRHVAAELLAADRLCGGGAPVAACSRS